MMDGDRYRDAVPQFEERAEQPDVDRRVKAGDPSGEHAIFVLLGIGITVIVFFSGLGLL